MAVKNPCLRTLRTIVLKSPLGVTNLTSPAAGQRDCGLAHELRVNVVAINLATILAVLRLYLPPFEGLARMSRTGHLSEKGPPRRKRAGTGCQQHLRAR